jgi:hypothetical protein
MVLVIGISSGGVSVQGMESSRQTSAARQGILRLDITQLTKDNLSTIIPEDTFYYFRVRSETEINHVENVGTMSVADVRAASKDGSGQ